MKTDIYLQIGDVFFQALNTDLFNGFNWQNFNAGDPVYVNNSEFKFKELKRFEDGIGCYSEYVTLFI